MKKLVLSLILMCTLALVYAQSVGINADGSQPDASAMLDVKSSSKGLLVPRIALTGTSDALTISNPATGLLVFNTNTASGITPGYYYNSGTSGAPTWTRLITSVAAADGSETLVNSGTLISVTGSGTTASPYVVNYSGTLPVASGGTGATTAAAARTNLGAGTSDLALGTTSSTAYRGDYGNTAYSHSQALTGSVHGSTTVGGNLMRLANPSAVKFLRFNADNSVSTLTAAEFRTAIGAGDGSGTVTSIATGNGITGGTITTTGTLGLTGQALAIHNLATNGLVTRTGAGTVAGRTFTASGNGISISNGDGVSGNPTVSLSIGTGSTQVAAGNHTHSEYAPAGSVMMWAGSSAPAGWFLCDGTSYSTTTYATLYGVIGTTYGSGSGTFKVPDLRSKIPVGKGTDTEFDALGETGGAKTHAITEAQLPSHTHGVGTLATNSNGAHDHSIDPPITTSADNGSHRHGYDDYYNNSEYSDDANDRVVGSDGTIFAERNTDYAGTHNHTLDIAAFNSASSGAHTHTLSGSTASTGSGSSINIIQPYIVLNYIIKY